MAKYIRRSKLKNTGGRFSFFRKKRKFETVSDSHVTKMGVHKLKIKNGRSNNKKDSLIFAEYANIITPKGTKKSRILDVQENKSNRHFLRQDIITKGAILKTEMGLAEVTSRPGQDGIVNAVLVKEK